MNLAQPIVWTIASMYGIFFARGIGHRATSKTTRHSWRAVAARSRWHGPCGVMPGVIFEAVFSYDLNYISPMLEVTNNLWKIWMLLKPSLNHHTKVTLAELLGDFALLWKKELPWESTNQRIFPNARQQSLPMSSYGNNVPKCFSKPRREAG